MRKLGLFCALVGAFVLGGCKGKDKAVSSAEAEAAAKRAQNEARLLATEADFAVKVRDYAGAEKALVKAAELVPEDHSLWIGIGLARSRLKNKDGARKAYERGSELLEKLYQKDPAEPGTLIAQIEVLLLLNREPDARKAYDRLLREHPNHPRTKAFVGEKEWEAMLSSPELLAHRV